MFKKIIAIVLATATLCCSANIVSADNGTYYTLEREVSEDLVEGHIVYFKKSVTPGRSRAVQQINQDLFFNQGPEYQKIDEYYKLCNSDERGTAIQTQGVYVYFGNVVFVRLGTFLKDGGEVVISSCHRDPYITKNEYEALVKKYIDEKDEYTEYDGPPREYVPTAVNGNPTGIENSNDYFIYGTYFDWRRDR